MNSLPQRILGHLVHLGRVNGLMKRTFRGKRIRMDVQTLEQQRFENDVRNQLLQLKKKGLSIPIFTL